jgi:hypothetical protein
MPGYERTTDRNPNADVRHRLNSPFATQKEREEARTEQKRREDNENLMRALSRPDSAINREKAMPRESEPQMSQPEHPSADDWRMTRKIRKEGYSNERLNIILETIEAILMESVAKGRKK